MKKPRKGRGIVAFVVHPKTKKTAIIVRADLPKHVGFRRAKVWSVLECSRCGKARRGIPLFSSSAKVLRRNTLWLDVMDAAWSKDHPCREAA